MRRLALPFALLAALGLFGCGGGSNPLTVLYQAVAVPSTVATGGTSTITATITEGGATTVTYTVSEGSAGGTVVANSNTSQLSATYTAPNSTGTYHVVVKFFEDGELQATRTVAIIVQAAI